MIDETVEKIKILQVQPGDIVVFQHPGILSGIAHENIRAILREILPDNVQILILEEGADIKLLRPEPITVELAERLKSQ